MEKIGVDRSKDELKLMKRKTIYKSENGIKLKK